MRVSVASRVEPSVGNVLGNFFRESLEQLRWLENGYRIMVRESKTETLGIDTPEDLEKAIAYLRRTERNER